MKIPGLAVPVVLAGVGTTVLLVTACGPDRGGEGWAGQVDTLSTGVVVVRSPQEPVWDPAAAWTVVETLRVGSLEGDGPDVFGSIGGLVVDREERIWIVDRQTYDLRIFAPDGSHLRTVGRRGGGPGEFGDPIGVTLAPDGRVWVVDPGNARFSIHGPEGDLEESRPRPVGGYAVPWRGGFDQDGRFWEAGVVPRTGGPRGAILRFDAELQPLDTLLLPQRPGEWSFELHLEGSVMMSAAVPFAPAALWARSPGGTVWVAGDGAYRLHRLTEDGDTARTVERAFAPVPVSTEERAEAIEGRGSTYSTPRVAFSAPFACPQGSPTWLSTSSSERPCTWWMWTGSGFRASSDTVCGDREGWGIRASGRSRELPGEGKGSSTRRLGFLTVEADAT